LSDAPPRAVKRAGDQVVVAHKNKTASNDWWAHQDCAAGTDACVIVRRAAARRKTPWRSGGRRAQEQDRVE
jgi:hypothetical protein